MPAKLFSKEQLIAEIRRIAAEGWHDVGERKHHGGIGNALERLLGIEENNLPIPNAAEWEIKTQKANTTALITLAHIEPSPQAAKIVISQLLPLYGWPHKEAGARHPQSERSFRQTLTTSSTDRGFRLVVNESIQRIEVHFDATDVSPRHQAWLQSVVERVGTGPLDPMPYWGFDDLCHKLGVKLLNTFLVEVKTRGLQFQCIKLKMLRGFTKDRMITCIGKNYLKADFDARTGHNHGTKFRIPSHRLADFYSEVVEIDLLSHKG